MRPHTSTIHLHIVALLMLAGSDGTAAEQPAAPSPPRRSHARLWKVDTTGSRVQVTVFPGVTIQLYETGRLPDNPVPPPPFVHQPHLFLRSEDPIRLAPLMNAANQFRVVLHCILDPEGYKQTVQAAVAATGATQGHKVGSMPLNQSQVFVSTSNPDIFPATTCLLLANNTFEVSSLPLSAERAREVLGYITNVAAGGSMSITAQIPFTGEYIDQFNRIHMHFLKACEQLTEEILNTHSAQRVDLLNGDYLLPQTQEIVTSVQAAHQRQTAVLTTTLVAENDDAADRLLKAFGTLYKPDGTVSLSITPADGAFDALARAWRATVRDEALANSVLSAIRTNSHQAGSEGDSLSVGVTQAPSGAFGVDLSSSNNRSWTNSVEHSMEGHIIVPRALKAFVVRRMTINDEAQVALEDIRRSNGDTSFTSTVDTRSPVSFSPTLETIEITVPGGRVPLNGSGGHPSVPGGRHKQQLTASLTLDTRKGEYERSATVNLRYETPGQDYCPKCEYISGRKPLWPGDAPLYPTKVTGPDGQSIAFDSLSALGNDAPGIGVKQLQSIQHDEWPSGGTLTWNSQLNDKSLVTEFTASYEHLTGRANLNPVPLHFSVWKLKGPSSSRE